jgi:hypothetical protein
MADDYSRGRSYPRAIVGLRQPNQALQAPAKSGPRLSAEAVRRRNMSTMTTNAVISESSTRL